MNDEEDAGHQGGRDGDLDTKSLHQRDRGREGSWGSPADDERTSDATRALSDDVGGEQSAFQLPVSPKSDADGRVDVSATQRSKGDDGEGYGDTKRQRHDAMAGAKRNTSTACGDHEGRAEELASEFPAHGVGVSLEVQSLRQERSRGHLTR